VSIKNQTEKHRISICNSSGTTTLSIRTHLRCISSPESKKTIRGLTKKLLRSCLFYNKSQLSTIIFRITILHTRLMLWS